MYHVHYGVEERWFTSRAELEAFVKSKRHALDMKNRDG